MSPAARSARSARVRFLRGAAGRRSEVATTRIPTARATLGTHIGYSHTLGTDMGTLGTLGTHTLPDQQSTAMYRFLCCSRRTARLTPSRGSPPLPTLAATHAHAPPPSADRRPRGRREAQARDASALACRREASRPLPLCIGTRLWRCGSRARSTPHAARLDDRVLASALRLRWRRCIENPVNHMFPVSALQARRLRWLPLRTTAHANRIAHILHAHANEPGWSSEHGVVWARSLSHGAW